MTDSEKAITAQEIIEPRRTPVQARSRERVERILDAVAQLLTERGYDAVKTNHIAKRAGVSIGSIYQFFPNRYAIFHALAARYLDRVAEILGEHLGPQAPERPWEQVITEVIDILAEMWRSELAFHAVWLAIQNTAELRAADEHYNKIFVDQYLVHFLGGILPHTSREERGIMGRVIFEVSQLLLDCSMKNQPDQDALMVAELKTVLLSYLKTHIERGNTAPSAS